MLEEFRIQKLPFFLPTPPRMTALLKPPTAPLIYPQNSPQFYSRFLFPLIIIFQPLHLNKEVTPSPSVSSPQYHNKTSTPSTSVFQQLSEPPVIISPSLHHIQSVPGLKGPPKTRLIHLLWSTPPTISSTRTRSANPRTTTRKSNLLLSASRTPPLISNRSWNDFASIEKSQISHLWNPFLNEITEDKIPEQTLVNSWIHHKYVDLMNPRIMGVSTDI